MHARRLMALALAVLLAAGLVAAGGTASGAAASSYLAIEGPIQRSGFWGSAPSISDQQVMSIGYTQCDLLRRGLGERAVLREMVGYDPAPGSRAFDLGIGSIRNAKRYICP